jgi:hypothetical protein
MDLVILRFALILVFSGLVLLVLALRSAQKRDFLSIETLIDGFSRRLLREPCTNGLKLFVVSLFQSLGCLLLAGRSRLTDSEWRAQKKLMTDRFESLRSLLSSDKIDVQALAGQLEEWQQLRHQTLTDLLVDQALFASDKGAEIFKAGRLSTFAADAPFTEIFSVIEQDWDLEAWGFLEKGAMRIGNLRWAFSEETLLEADVRSLLDQVTLIYQSFGPVYALLRVQLQPAQQLQLDAALDRWTTALGQCFFTGQIALRLSRLPEGSAEAYRKDQAAGCFQLISSSLMRLMSWLNETEAVLFGQLLSTDGGPALAAQSKSFSDLGRELLAESLELTRALGDTVTASWRVQELIYGHLRGQEVVTQLQLKCVGCHLAETEYLSGAALVHDFKLDSVLAILESKQ